MNRVVALPLILALGTARSVAAQGRDVSAALVVQGPADRAAAQRLGPAVTAELRRRGWPVLAPAELVARIAQHARVRETLARARTLLAAAETAIFDMRRADALASDSRATDQLIAVAAALHAPRLLAQAHAARARALLLAPADDESALLAFAAAVAIDPAYAPGDAGLPPRAEELLRAARRAPDLAAAQPDLAAVLALAGLEAIVVVAPAAQDPQRLLVAVHHRDAGGALRTLRRRTAQRDAESVAAAALELAAPLRGPAATAAAAIAARTPRAAAAPRPRRARPWYRRWWVWTAAGAVLAGAGVGLALVAQAAAPSPQPPPRFDFRFDFR